MIIAIPTDNNTMDNKISPVFGRAAYFLIYDTDNPDIQFINNTAVNSTGGAGVKAAQIIVDSPSNILITPRLGLNAANLLKS